MNRLTFLIMAFFSCSAFAENSDPWSEAFPGMNETQSSGTELASGAALASGLFSGAERSIRKEIRADALELAQEQLLSSDKNYHKVYYEKKEFASMHQDFVEHFEGKKIPGDAKIFGLGVTFDELQKREAEFSAKYAQYLAEKDAEVKSRASQILADLRAGRISSQDFAKDVKDAKRLHLYVAPLYLAPAYMIFSGVSRLNHAVRGVETGYRPVIEDSHASAKVPAKAKQLNFAPSQGAESTIDSQ
jgi:hypothetical protein